MFTFASFPSWFGPRVPPNITSADDDDHAPLDDSECRIIHDPDKESHKFDFIFIHDAVPNNHDAWKEPDSDELWPTHLKDEFSSARVFVYQYNRNWIRTIEDIVCPDHVRNLSKELLQFLESDDRKSSVPLVVFAHGFGGLLYEQAFVWSVSDSDNAGKVLCTRNHAAFLFGTPHFGAGIAEWAIMIAKSHGINCARTAQAQDWSSVKDKIAETAKMQRDFRERLKSYGSGAIMTGCFSTLPEPVSQLTLASEWAVLPEFMPIPIQGEHSSMTRFRKEDAAFEAIKIALESVLKQLTRTTPMLATNPAESPAIRESEAELTGKDSINDSLVDRITHSLVDSAFHEPKRKFLPGGFLKILLTRETVGMEIWRWRGGEEGYLPEFDNRDSRIIDFIVDDAKRLFAILLYCKIDTDDIIASLHRARGDRFNDKQLPFVDLSPGSRSTWPSLFKNWQPEFVTMICQAQWTFLAPAFSPQRFSSARLDAFILPLVSIHDKEKIDAFYRVQRSTMAPSQLTQEEGSSHYENVVLETVSTEDRFNRLKTMRVCCMALPVNIVKRIVDLTVHEAAYYEYYILFETSLDDYRLFLSGKDNQLSESSAKEFLLLS